MEVTVGLNHGKQTVEPLTQADLERNDRTQVGLAACRSSSRRRTRSRIVPNANFGAAGLALGTTLPATLGVEGRYPFFGAERHLEQLGQPDQGRWARTT